KGGDGSAFLLGLYGYKNNLCPHGIARGARDVAYFLKEQWGAPTKTFDRPMEAPKEIQQMTGVIAFIKLIGNDAVQGHMDVWNVDKAQGHAYFASEKVLFWKLDGGRGPSRTRHGVARRSGRGDASEAHLLHGEADPDRDAVAG